MPQIRMSPERQRELRMQGLKYAVIVNRDVSVVIPGAVQGVLCHERDAFWYRDKLNEMYGDEEGFAVVELGR